MVSAYVTQAMTRGISACSIVK